MVDLDTIVSLCKRRGFIFQSSEIYGGLGSAWDYGPLGVEYKNNIKRLWWRDNVQLRDDMVGLDAAISMHPKVWEASGHVASFSDPFTGCNVCHRHYRADQIYEAIWNSRWFRSLLKTLEGPAAREGEWRAVLNWAETDGKKLASNFSVDRSLLLQPGLKPTLREQVPTGHGVDRPAHWFIQQTHHQRVGRPAVVGG